MYMIKKSNEGLALYEAIWQLSFFYMSWALYKKIFLGDEHELGHFSFGFLTVASYFERKWPSIVANVVLLANFALAVVIIVSMDPKSLAQLVKQDDSALGVAWAFTFDAYIFSSIGIWSFCLRKLCQLPESPYTSLPTLSA